jgi:hypothetical protein
MYEAVNETFRRDIFIEGSKEKFTLIAAQIFHGVKGNEIDQIIPFTQNVFFPILHFILMKDMEKDGKAENTK